MNRASKRGASTRSSGARYTLGASAPPSRARPCSRCIAPAQRLLRPLRVFNPYADQLTFLDDKTRTRRDHTKYLQLIATVAVLHQHQREIRAIDCGGGKTAPCVVATLDDIAPPIVSRMKRSPLPRTTCRRRRGGSSRSSSAKSRRRCTAAKLERGDCRFTRRQVREVTGWSNTQLHVHLKRLED